MLVDKKQKERNKYGRKKYVKSYCASCCNDTNHEILHTVTDSFRDEYVCDIEYQIVECRGCVSRLQSYFLEF